MTNTKRQIFYSFHFDNDVKRVQQVRNIGALEDNKPVSANEWEEVKRKKDVAIEKWIDDNMKYRSCVVVLVGEKTAERKWIKKEIEKAWNSKKGLIGIYIHNLKDPQTGKCNKGKNPFETFTLKNGKEKLSDYVKCYNPSSYDAYNDIRNNIERLVEEAISIRNNY
ncbi:MAG TPA: molecular chaperone Tir [Ignavibacteria bacterium]|nr:molecular chaperone Tir [Ignavibacteria bacterium]